MAILMLVGEWLADLVKRARLVHTREQSPRLERGPGMAHVTSGASAVPADSRP